MPVILSEAKNLPREQVLIDPSSAWWPPQDDSLGEASSAATCEKYGAKARSVS
ncbi:MAG: hypothetical protein WA148_02265 [Actinomycetota bacterium]